MSEIETKKDREKVAEIHRKRERKGIIKKEEAGVAVNLAGSHHSDK